MCCDRCRDRGQATVEFAFVLPLVLILVLGVVQVARVTALQVAAIEAARAGARVGAVDPDPAAAVAAASGVAGARVDVARTAGDPALVTVRVWRPVALLPGMGWSTVTVAAATTMAVEAPP